MLKIMKPDVISRHRAHNPTAHPNPYTDLAEAVTPHMPPNKVATELERWNAIWGSGYDISRLYRAGLEDSHIDSALIKISKTILNPKEAKQ